FIEGQSLAEVIRELKSPGLPEGAGQASQVAAALASGSTAPPDTAPVDETARPSAASTRTRAFCREVAHLGIQAAEALDYAHSLGVIHRDVKPANLMIDSRGALWVADFGLARLPGDPGMTMTGDLVGTLRYMSPEQALARRGLIDQRTDIY